MRGRLFYLVMKEANMTTHEIIEALSQGLPFTYNNHQLIAIPFDNCMKDMCHWCDLENECSELNDAFIYDYYFGIIDTK